MKYQWVLAILFGGLVLVVGFCFLASNVYYQRGVKLLKDQRTYMAEKEFYMAVRLNPFNAEAHFRRSLCLPRMRPTPLRPTKECLEIEKELRWVIRLKPNHAEAHNSLGTILSDQGYEEEAVQEYRQAIRLNPNKFYFHRVLGRKLWDLGKLEEAEKEFREAIRLKPDTSEQPDLHYLVMVLMAQGKYTEAEREARLIPEDRSPLYLSQIFDKQGRLAEAVKEYREAIKKWMPGCYWIYGDLGVVLAREGKFKDAEDTILQGFRLSPDYPPFHYQLGCCYALWGKTEKAIVSLQKAADKGYDQWPAIEKDTLLNTVRGDPRFIKIVRKVRENWGRRGYEIRM